MRCIMCNNPLKSSEIIWYEEEKRHEEYCSRCRDTIAFDEAESGEVESLLPEVEIIYGVDTIDPSEIL